MPTVCILLGLLSSHLNYCSGEGCCFSSHDILGCGAGAGESLQLRTGPVATEGGGSCVLGQRQVAAVLHSLSGERSSRSPDSSEGSLSAHG